MSKTRRQILNRSVRAWCPGGNETLDALELMHKVSDRHAEHTEAGKISRLSETKLNEIANAMRDQAMEWQKEEAEKDYNMNIKITTSANETAIVPDQSEKSIRKAMHQLGYSGFSQDPNLRFYYRAPGGNENWVGCTVEPTDEPIHEATNQGNP